MADTEGAEGPGVGHEQRSRIGVGGSAAPTRSRAAAQRNGTSHSGVSKERRRSVDELAAIAARTMAEPDDFG